MPLAGSWIRDGLYLHRKLGLSFSLQRFECCSLKSACLSPTSGVNARIERAFLLFADIAAGLGYGHAAAPCLPMSEEQPKAFLEAVRFDVDLPDKLKGTSDAEAVGLGSLILESGITEL